MFLGISDDIVKKDGDFMMRIGGINSPWKQQGLEKRLKSRKRRLKRLKMQ